MQTNIRSDILSTPQGQEADKILRACVHCGFCTATCPTYQLLGDELDSPRGRIYLIKQMLEGNEVTHKTQLHLDRCLTCRSCETTCPSGVRYGKLIDIGREITEHHVTRSMFDKLKRYTLRKIIPYPQRFAGILKLAQWTKPLLPSALKQKIPVLSSQTQRPQRTHSRRMLILEGCAQSVISPNTNHATVRVLDKLGIEVISAASAGCCGAVSQHLSATDDALEFVRRNIDAWWPFIEQGVEAVIVTASGCGVMVKDYGELLKHNPIYANKAKRVSELCKDLAEILSQEKTESLKTKASNLKVAFHCPCTLQHGQKLQGKVESILKNSGFNLTQVADNHLCCGSAGTYSILQPKLSQQLLDNKLSALQHDKPDIIVTANIGCQMHLASKATIPVKHWIELLEEA